MASEIKIGRSAVSGKFVKLSYAKKHPRTTVVDTITRPTRRAQRPKKK